MLKPAEGHGQYEHTVHETRESDAFVRELEQDARLLRQGLPSLTLIEGGLSPRVIGPQERSKISRGKSTEAIAVPPSGWHEGLDLAEERTSVEQRRREVADALGKRTRRELAEHRDERDRADQLAKDERDRADQLERVRHPHASSSKGGGSWTNRRRG